VTAPSPPAPTGVRAEPKQKRGVGALLKQVGKDIMDDNVPGQAAQLAYYGFVALPPALMALFGAAGLIGSERFAAWLQGNAALTMPPAVTESIIGPFIDDVVLNSAPGLFSIGLLLALWGASAVFSGLIVALNIAFGERETRSWVKTRAIALGTMVGAVILFLLAAVALLAGPDLAEAAGLGDTGLLVWNILQWPIAFAFMVTAFWTTYYVLPNRDQRRCKLVLMKAAAVAAAGWVLATAAFRLYIANFSSYTETYGFLGAFIILLLWLYVTGIVVLAGGELAAAMQEGS
jgi:membrane protein